MFTHKDIETRSVFVINCFDKERSLKLRNGELLLSENQNGKDVTLTKFPFQKILALFVIGSMNITTPLIEKCKKYAVALIVVKANLRPVFIMADAAEGNFLLRQRQHRFEKEDLSVAKVLVRNKICNQLSLLNMTRKKDKKTKDTVTFCQHAIEALESTTDYNSLMGLEGAVSKAFFAAYFQALDWHGRYPRIKCDEMNVCLDIGYHILFNFVECIVRLFGFDVYVGVYHRLWFKRKSLICDLMEPFRCIIDHTILLAFNRKQFSKTDFELVKHEYKLKQEECSKYYKIFCDGIIANKAEMFSYVQQYYRCFMGQKAISTYPIYNFK